MSRERPRHRPEPAQAEAALDEKGQALAALLEETLQEFHPEMGAALDEVVVTIQPHQVVEVGRKLRDDPHTSCDFLMCLSVVDYHDRFEMGILFHKARGMAGIQAENIIRDQDLSIAVAPGPDTDHGDIHLPGDLCGKIFGNALQDQGKNTGRLQFFCFADQRTFFVRFFSLHPVTAELVDPLGSKPQVPHDRDLMLK